MHVTQMHAHTHTDTQTHTCNTQACKHMHVKQMHAHTHALTHTHTYIYTHYTIGSQTGVREVVQGVRGENISAITENGRNSQNVAYRLKQNCNFQKETSFCASKSPKFPCILHCKAVFLSNKHNNNCN